MTNQEHLDILLQGVEKWNQWRNKHADIRPDLSSADLNYANLSSANLSRGNLTFTMLVGTNLKNVSLTDCSIYGISVWNAGRRTTFCHVYRSTE